MKITESNIEAVNSLLKDRSPEEIINFVLENANEPIVTTNFRPYEAAILHACTEVQSDIKVIWCDTGYNTTQTYRHAEVLKNLLDLNIHLYVPEQTVAHRDVVLGIPEVNTEKHDEFTEQVKLEPFRRAFAIHRPDVWFTNLRKGQTAHRDSLDILSFANDGTLKVSPFFYWSDQQLDAYLEIHDLPNEFKYYDPTKVLENRECGLHA